MRHVLVLEISDGSAEGQISIDALVADKVICGIDALLFIRVVWLVVLGELNDFLSLFDKDGAAIACVCAVNIGRRDEYDAAGATGILSVIFFRHLFIDLHEALLKSAFVVLLFPRRKAG